MKIDLDTLLTSDPLKLNILKEIGKAAEVAELSCYAVGGIVRDALLQRPNTDIDVMVVGDSLAFAEQVAARLQIKTIVRYEKFATAMIPYQKLNIEIAAARREVYSEDSRKPSVEYTDLDEDLSRRDFTVNAMAVDIRPEHWGEFHDLFGGVRDMELQVLRTPRDPEETFFDDPLRMMRAVRFASQLQYRIDSGAWDAIQKMAERLKIISMERIRDELSKIMLSEKPSIGIILLKNSGLMDQFLPEFSALAGVEEVDGFAHKDVFYHTAQVVDNISRYSEDPVLRYAAMFHDIAKPPTKRFKKGLGWTYHGHEDLGAKMFNSIGRRLRLPIRDIKRISKLIRLHLRPISIASEGVTDSAVRRLMVDAGDEIDGLLTLCRSDITSQNREKVRRFHENFDRVAQRIQDVEEKDKLRNFQSPVDGNAIMELFGIPPGPLIGKLKSTIENAILEGDVPNNEEAVREWIESNLDIFKQLIADHPVKTR